MPIFDDFFSSARGPGVIGIMLGMFILLGFGLLFLFVTDERFIGWEKDPAGEIRTLEEEINRIHGQIADAKVQQEQRDNCRRMASQITSLEIERNTLRQRLDELQGAKAAAERIVAKLRADWNIYQERYRSAERGRAKGERYERLEIAGGRVFENVEVLNVDAVRMQVRHQGGVVGIDWKSLPSGMQDRFQFDVVEKQAQVAVEARAEHSRGMAHKITDVCGSIAQKQREIAENERKERAIETQVQALSQQMEGLSGQLAGKQQELSAEASKKLRHTERILIQIRELEYRQAELPRKIGALQLQAREARQQTVKLRSQVAILEGERAKLMKDCKAAQAEAGTEKPQ